jgi:hypothetical protein
MIDFILGALFTPTLFCFLMFAWDLWSEWKHKRETEKRQTKLLYELGVITDDLQVSPFWEYIIDPRHEGETDDQFLQRIRKEIWPTHRRNGWKTKRQRKIKKWNQ